MLLTAFPSAAGPSLAHKYWVVRPGTHQHSPKIVRVRVADSMAYALHFISANQGDSLGPAGAAQRNRFYNSLVVVS